jgi:hypothetical protein
MVRNYLENHLMSSTPTYKAKVLYISIFQRLFRSHYLFVISKIFSLFLNCLKSSKNKIIQYFILNNYYLSLAFKFIRYNQFRSILMYIDKFNIGFGIFHGQNNYYTIIKKFYYLKQKEEFFLIYFMASSLYSFYFL